MNFLLGCLGLGIAVIITAIILFLRIAIRAPKDRLIKFTPINVTIVTGLLVLALTFLIIVFVTLLSQR